MTVDLSAPRLAERERLRPLFGAWDSIFAPSFRMAPYNPDLLTTQKGYDLYDQMLTMAACRAPFNLKRYSVLAKGWKILPHQRGSDPLSADHAQAAELAAFVQEMLEDITLPDTDQTQDFRRVLFELMRALWTGFQVSEIEWRLLTSGKWAGRWGLAQIAAKPCKQIGFDLDENSLAVRAFKPYTPLHGYGPPVPIEKALLYTFNPDRNLPYGNGDGRPCYKHWFGLDGILKFWLIALERFGGGFLIAQYPAGNPQAQEDAQVALDEIRQGVAAVLPDNVKYSLEQASQGMFAGFKEAADWQKQEIAQVILGNTLTTGEGKHGTQALGDVHENTQETGVDFVRRDIEGVINTQLIRRAVRYNFGERALALCPRLSLGEQQPEDLYQLAQAFEVLVRMGSMDRQAKIIRERMGLPPLDAEEESRLKQQEQMQQKATPQQQALLNAIT